MKLLWALALTTVSLFADVTGKWSGNFDVTMDGETRNETAVLILKQDGNTVTGTAGPNEDKQMKIRSGVLDGNTLTLDVIDEEGDHPPIHLVLNVDGDHMTGNAKAQHEDRVMEAKLDLKREK